MEDGVHSNIILLQCLQYTILVSYAPLIQDADIELLTGGVRRHAAEACSMRGMSGASSSRGVFPAKRFRL